ncbi:MAG: hypothetical protein M3Q44_07950 [bacterium]|nr:hypothetical protein [bacterium]
MKNSSFGQLFHHYRLKSGLDTYAKFGQALAEEGFVYEDSIFSKWKNGERVPRDRKILLGILKIFVQNKAIIHTKEANEFLTLVGLRDLDDSELSVLSFNTISEVAPYSAYKPVLEPSTFFQSVPVDSVTARALVLEDIPEGYKRDYWKYRVRCSIAEYYSRWSSKKTSPEEAFHALAYDYYEQAGRTVTALVIVTDPADGSEYLAATMRAVTGENQDSHVLEVMDLFEVSNGWTHEKLNLNLTDIAELSRFVIPNWAISEKVLLSKMLRASLTASIRSRGIKFLYCIISAYLPELLKEANILVKEVELAIPYHLKPNAKELHPNAYSDALKYDIFWKEQDPKLCYVTNFAI